MRTHQTDISEGLKVLRDAFRPAVEKLIELSKSDNPKIARAATRSLVKLCVDARQTEVERQIADLRRELSALRRQIKKHMG